MQQRIQAVKAFMANLTSFRMGWVLIPPALGFFEVFYYSGARGDEYHGPVSELIGIISKQSLVWAIALGWVFWLLCMLFMLFSPNLFLRLFSYLPSGYWLTVTMLAYRHLDPNNPD